MAVEPNIETHVDIKLISYEGVKEKADIFVFLVAHKEFRSFNNVYDKYILDFCGVTEVG